MLSKKDMLTEKKLGVTLDGTARVEVRSVESDEVLVLQGTKVNKEQEVIMRVTYLVIRLQHLHVGLEDTVSGKLGEGLLELAEDEDEVSEESKEMG